MRRITQAQLDEILCGANTGKVNINLNFDGMDLENCDFRRANLEGASFVRANLEGVNFRQCNLTGINIEGANLYFANLEGATVKNVLYNGETRWFNMRCPEKGAFLGYKKCFNFRVVQLLIPENAKRLSATNAACRCDMAKVLSIKSPDLKVSYKEACSYFDESFIYTVGETVRSKGFCEDRWNDSSPGIHFYLTRKEALGYL